MDLLLESKEVLQSLPEGFGSLFISFLLLHLEISGFSSSESDDNGSALIDLSLDLFLFFERIARALDLDSSRSESVSEMEDFVFKIASLLLSERSDSVLTVLDDLILESEPSCSESVSR